MERRLKYNSFSVVLILFLYSLATLPSLLVDNKILIIFLSVVMLVPNLKLNLILHIAEIKKVILIVVLLLFFLITQILIYPEYSQAIVVDILYLLTLGFLGMSVGSMHYHLPYCIKYGNILALICFVTSTLFIFFTKGSFDVSMRFGYAMLPSTLWFFKRSIEGDSKISLALFFFSLVLLILYGSRGTLVVLILFITFFLFRKITLKKLIILLFFVYIVLMYHELIFGFLVQIMQSVADLSGARKIQGIISIFSGGIGGNVAGRDVLYQRCIDLFCENPFVGCGVGFWSKDPVMNGLFPHNIFLQVMTEFGLFGSLLFIVIMVKITMELFRCKGKTFLFLLYIFSISFGRLLVSSMFWARPEFWLIIGLVFINVHSPSEKKLV